MPKKNISIRISEDKIEQIEEIRDYYKLIMGVELNVSGIVRIAISNLYEDIMGEKK